MRPHRRAGRLLAVTTTAFVAWAAVATAAVANPIVTEIYTADPAALVHDGRMYIYTGRDEASPNQNNFVMREWHAFSSANPSPDPGAWTHHGSPLSLASFSWGNANAWASEVVRGPDGRFYWFVSINSTFPGREGMGIGVAVADTPAGPFTDAIGGPLIWAGMAGSSSLDIDPTVLVDDDGQIYLYWGSFWQPRVAKLSNTMTALDGPIMTPQGLGLFWEAPWIFKRGGLYYLAFASNENSQGDGCVTSSNYACIRYATATNPLGPWTHRGIVLDQVSSTTNHPSIVEFEGQWWMVYHTADAPGGGDFRRSVAIDRLYFSDGTMRKVVQTRGEPDGNAALSATPTCSYTSPWESCAAINNGDNPASSNIPGPNQGTRWGTWPQTGQHWAQLTWDSPVRVNRSDMYFFQDVADTFDGGVKRPQSWLIQYWTGSQWVNVANPSGYATALDTDNSTTFDPVTTTRLRVLMQTRTTPVPADGVGVLEWRVYPAPSG